MTTVYEYTKTTQPDLSQIQDDVDSSAMSQDGKDDYEFSSWSEDDEKLYCTFTDDLTSGDKTVFDAIIAALPADSVKKVWDQISLPITEWQRIGASQPAVGLLGMEVAYRFDDTLDEECFIVVVRPDGWDGESDMKLVVWVKPNDTQTGDKAVRMLLRYATVVEGDQYLPSSWTHTNSALTFDLPTGVAQKTEVKIPIVMDYDDADNPLSKRKIMMRLSRVGSHAEDTMTGDLIISMAALRFQRNAFGDPE